VAVIAALLALLAVADGIAAASATRPVIACGSKRGGPVRIHVLGIGIGTQRVLQSRSLGMGVEPGWTPDGRRLAISTSDASGQYFGIAVLDANGAGRRMIKSGHSWDERPAWSRDG